MSGPFRLSSMTRSQADPRRRTIRLVAAAASAMTALIYFGIGVGALRIVETVDANTPDLLIFGAAAGGVFVIGAVLLIATDVRPLWLLGAILQVGVIVMYVAVAPSRNPPFEVWGIVIKFLQVAILAALAYLLVRPPVVAAGHEAIGARR